MELLALRWGWTQSGPMKIWMLTHELPRPLCGGIARYTDQMATALTAAGHQVAVIGLADKASDRTARGAYRLLSIPSREFAHREAATEPCLLDEAPEWPYNSLNRDLAVAWEMAEVLAQLALDEGAPDVIEVPEYKALGVFIKQRQLTNPDYLPGVAVVVMLHTPEFVVRRFNQEPTHTIPHYWVGQQEKASIAAADALCAPSAFIAEEMRRMLESPELTIDTCPLPMTVPAEPDPAPAVDPREVLFFGRLEARKGVLELMRAMDRLWRRGRDVRLTLLGPSIPFPPKGQQMQAFLEKRYARWIREGKLLIIPGLDHDRALERLQRAAVVVIPSLWENFPYACLETMALGQVVLASEHGGMREMIAQPGQEGFLFSWKRETDFEKQLEAALSLDPEARQAMGMAARERIASLCAPGKVAAARLQTYQRAIEKARQGLPSVFPFPPDAMPGPMRFSQTEAAEGDQPLISVVIPFYNLGAFLPEALESVLNSDYPHLEVLIMNDGSDDPDSLAVLEKIEAEGDARVRVIHNENQGLSATRNAGAALAKGPWVAFVDADDAVEPAFLRRAAWVLQQYDNVHLVASWIRFFGDGQGIWHSWNLQFPYLLAHNLMIPICLVRKDSFLRFARNAPEMAYGLEDYEGWIGLLKNGCGGVAIPEVLTRYRVRGQSMFQSINREQQMYLYQVVVQRHPELYQRYGTELFQLLFANGPAHDMDQPTMWGAPYDILKERLLEPLFEERKKTAAQWRDSVELRGKLQNALLEAEKQWKEGCELRERLSALDQRHQEALQELDTLKQQLQQTPEETPSSTD